MNVRDLRIIIVILLLSSFNLFSQDGGMLFFEGSFEEALLKAKEEDKLVFVDAYTTWCGPCKMMKRNVFPNEEVGEYYNEVFINMAIDMETQAGKSFNMKYPVSGYPTLLYINPDGNLIKKSVGAKNVERFLSLGAEAIKADDRSGIYTDMYENGRRDFDFMVKYIKALNKVDKPTSRIAYAYLEGDYGLNNEQKAVIIFESISSCDSKMFDMMTSKKYKKHLLTRFGENAYNDKVYKTCWATVEKGIEFNVNELIEEGKKKFKDENRDDYKTFEVETDLAVARSASDASSYLKAAKKRIKLFEDPNDINEFLIEMIDFFPSYPKILEFAFTESESIVKEHDTIETNFAFARILIANKKLHKSIDYLNKALTLANEEKKYLRARDIHLLRKEVQARIKG